MSDVISNGGEDNMFDKSSPQPQRKSHPLAAPPRSQPETVASIEPRDATPNDANHVIGFNGASDSFEDAMYISVDDLNQEKGNEGKDVEDVAKYASEAVPLRSEQPAAPTQPMLEPQQAPAIPFNAAVPTQLPQQNLQPAFILMPDLRSQLLSLLDNGSFKLSDAVKVQEAIRRIAALPVVMVNVVDD